MHLRVEAEPTMSTHRRHAYEPDVEDGERPSFSRVESFLAAIDERRRAARRARWIVFSVATAIGTVATLTALGLVPVEAENVALSATAVVAGLVLNKE
jgi:hypothetical protein